jgi:Cys-tRNA(Pro)/Cys-tRNA(Cys) deacylase
MSKKAKNAGNEPEKTNAARLLDRAKISYRLVPYEVDENDLSATHVAASIGEDPAQVFKTLVLHGERTGGGGYYVCVVPAAAEVDLKKAAKAAGMKKAEMIPMKELLPLTGYIRGGCTPIGMKKPFPTFFHTTITNFPLVYLSAGQRGLQFEIAPADIIGYVKGTVADLIKEE